MAYSGIYNPTDVIVTDSNAIDHCREGGYGLIARDFSREPYGSVAPEYSFPLLTWAEIRERAEYNDQNKCRTSDILGAKGFFDSNQGRTNYCWMHGFVNGMIGWRIIQNQPFVNLSAASAAAPANSFRNAGGYGSQAAKWLVENGVSTIDQWEANAIDRDLWTPKAKEIALLNRLTEWEDMPARDMRALGSALVQHLLCPVAFNWWGHLICGLDPVMTGPESFDLRCINSHGEGRHIVLQGRKAIPDDTQVIRGTTVYYP